MTIQHIETTTSGGKILWAENDPDQFALASQAVTTLLSRSGVSATITHVRDGAELFTEMSIGDTPDVLVVDIDMGEYGGLDIIPEVAKRWPGIPILIVSGLLDDENIKPVVEHFAETGYIRGSFGPHQHDQYAQAVVDALVRRIPSLLHISDLHFGRSQALTTPLLEEMFVGLCEAIKAEGSIELLVASGDFACIGSEAEFRSATRFLTEGVRTLGLDLSRLIIVPGNHDIDRTLPEGKRFSHYVDFLVELYSELKDPRQVYANYPALYDNERKMLRPNIRAGNGEALVCVRVYDELRTIVVGLNSVCPKDDELNYGRIEVGQWVTLNKRLKELSAQRSEYFKVAILHHNLFVVPSFRNDGEPERIVRNSSFVLHQLIELGFQLVLHGHTHYSAAHDYRPIDLERGSDSKGLLVVATGTLGSSDREASQPYGHAVTLRCHVQEKLRINSASISLFQLWDSSIRWRRGLSRLISFSR